MQAQIEVSPGSSEFMRCAQTPKIFIILILQRPRQSDVSDHAPSEGMRHVCLHSYIGGDAAEVLEALPQTAIPDEVHSEF